jgi:hypothetical protein
MEDGERDLEHVRRVAEGLMEHFDAVQVFATRHDGTRDFTVSVNYGLGNVHARRSVVRTWSLRQDEMERENVREDLA